MSLPQGHGVLSDIKKPGLAGLFYDEKSKSSLDRIQMR